MKKVMVVGATGVLGKLVCVELLRIFENQINLIVTDYKDERGNGLAKSLESAVDFQFLDVNNEENVKQVIRNIDIVIVALKQRTPHIQKACIQNKILCIDVTPFYDFFEKVIELNQFAMQKDVGSVIMSGFFPGLSGLMIKKAISNFQDVKEINVALLQSTNAKAGVSGIIDMLNIIAQPSVFQNKSFSGFTKKRKMYFFDYSKEQNIRLIDHSEKNLINEKLITVPVNYWTSWNSSGFNRLVSLLRRIGLLKYVHNFNKLLSKVVKHNHKKDENAFLTVEVKGMIRNKERVKVIALSTFSDYHATAMVTAALAKIASGNEVKGIVCPFEITDLDELLGVINCSGVKITEFGK
ncbi:saccharopine dehydrogenase-like NADP-dependent oxidoreductase [Natronobacillus azotifigens]|uniref:Saccharopine dehydrogenase NADP-binding domain-containing protein n=1 Tax=Natronobacillus azotifigens TaxID=472978 RepID=A0A9J6RC78_9BACI|nr:saccharopine dehydrogenase NADP-binding domain-containing protein [Natronobacillus azotifigens]MCZ0702908.1 saccharopine dehydrogenase NADP-binding domain-containing protein [Natronobacillus azotifigens]